MFETRSDAWERVGLSFEVNERLVQRARRQAAVLVILLVAIDVAYNIAYRNHAKVLRQAGLHSLETPIRILAVLALVATGWTLARAIGHFVGPTFLRRMDPATAGTFGFLTRLLTIAVAMALALNVAGVELQTLAVGGAFTAVVLGLAAQQTLGNVFAGMVLLSARPFRVGERVRLQAGAVGGVVEGVVSSLGLLYTTLTRGDDQILIPNNVVLLAVVVPLHEFDSVDVRVRLAAGVTPSQLQTILDTQIVTETRNPPSVVLEEIETDGVVVRIRATPDRHTEGAQLADEIIAALQGLTGDHPAVSVDQS